MPFSDSCGSDEENSAANCSDYEEDSFLVKEVDSVHDGDLLSIEQEMHECNPPIKKERLSKNTVLPGDTSSPQTPSH